MKEIEERAKKTVESGEERAKKTVESGEESERGEKGERRREVQRTERIGMEEKEVNFRIKKKWKGCRPSYPVRLPALAAPSDSS